MQARVQALGLPHLVDVLAGGEPAHHLGQGVVLLLRGVHIVLAPAAGGDEAQIGDDGVDGLRSSSLDLEPQIAVLVELGPQREELIGATLSSISRGAAWISLSSSPMRSRERCCSSCRNRFSWSGRPWASISSSIARYARRSSTSTVSWDDTDGHAALNSATRRVTDCPARLASAWARSFSSCSPWDTC